MMMDSAGAGGPFDAMISFLREERQAVDMQRREMLAQAAAQQQAEEAISATQLGAIQLRLDGLGSAGLLVDVELFALQDLITDWVELKATMQAAAGGAGGTAAGASASIVITVMMVLAAASSGSELAVAAVKAHKLVAISEAIPNDATFARQVKRKLLTSTNE